MIKFHMSGMVIFAMELILDYEQMVEHCVQGRTTKLDPAGSELGI